MRVVSQARNDAPDLPDGDRYAPDDKAQNGRSLVRGAISLAEAGTDGGGDKAEAISHHDLKERPIGFDLMLGWCALLDAIEDNRIDRRHGREGGKHAYVGVSLVHENAPKMQLQCAQYALPVH